MIRKSNPNKSIVLTFFDGGHHDYMLQAHLFGQLLLENVASAMVASLTAMRMTVHIEHITHNMPHRYRHHYTMDGLE